MNMRNDRKQLKILLLVVLVLAIVLPVVLAACDDGSVGPSDSSSEESSGSSDSTGTSGSPGVISNYWPKYDNYDMYAEMRGKLEKWLVDNYINGTKAPFSFTYGAIPSTLFIKKWTRNVSSSEDDEAKYYTLSYTNPDDGFKVWSEFVLFKDYPTLEWCSYAKNTGDKNSKVISSFMGMDVKYDLDSENLVLHTTEGSLDIGGPDVNDFKLITQPLSGMAAIYMPETSDGRSSEHAWPFFDVVGSNNGLMVAVGWTGIWKASFSSKGNSVQMSAGMANLNSIIYPDEQIRTPLYSITYFDGDAEYGHNLFRKTVLSHYTPDDGTENVCKLPVSVTTESYGEDDIISDVAKWAGKLSVDTVWTDAAWFGNTDKNSWGVETGNWWVNKTRYPSGSLKKVSDFLHENGKKYVVWFELERVASGTELFKKNMNLLINKNIVGSYILNLASEEGYQWVYNYLVKTIGDNGIDIYRQDFNSPGIAQAWVANDKPNRSGMTELRYVENMYRLYDALHEKFPGIMLDNCASGGKRIDIEMLKRMVILHRSDYTCVQYGYGNGQWNMEGIQYQTQNISYWLPLHGSSCGWPVYLFEDSYTARSLLSPGIGLGIQIGYAADSKLAQKLTKEMSDFRGYFIGNYYSLLEPVYDFSSRQAFMYVRDDLDEALFLIYSRYENNEDLRFTLKLKGLNPDTEYLITDRDSSKPSKLVKTGRELMDEGLAVNVYSGTAKVFILTPVK